jgi:hypothetical protein
LDSLTSSRMTMMRMMNDYLAPASCPLFVYMLHVVSTSPLHFYIPQLHVYPIPSSASIIHVIS